MLTPDLPGIGGRIKDRPEDFEVEEVPSYEPSGEGDHLYLWVEKRDVGPEYFARMIAQRVGVPVGTVGTAGLKDRLAVTRQWVSVPKEAEPRLSQIDGDGIKLLTVSRHTNKLKPGHLRGNRFKIRVREATNPTALTAIVERIRTQGMPNYYGPQRFGRDGSTVALGFDCLAGRQKKRLRPFVFKFALSAVQSLLFNRYLAARLTDGLFRTVLPGDVMMKWPGGGMFVSDDPAVDQPRFDAREIVSGGPMFGSRTYPAKGLAAEREQTILAASGLSPASFARFGKLASGTRRHNLIYLDDLSAEWHGSDVILGFTLPSGCYATVLLREIMKTDPPSEDEPASDDEE